ncbi:hypoxia up-regulated protein 1-like, partial [Saccoglossus kowalevskii]
IFGKRNLTRISLTGVADALNNNHDAESKGVKAHFRMDESGLLYLDKVESVFERLPPENETESEPEKEQSTFQKLGSTISSFFSGSKKEDTEAPVEEEEEEDEKPKPQEEEEKEEAADEKVAKEDEKKSEDEKESENEPKEEEKSDDEKDETKENETKEDETKEDEKKDQEKEDDKTEEKEPDTKSEKEEKPEEKEAKKKPPKPVTLKEEIKMEVSLLDLPNPSKESRKLSVGKLEELKKKDEEKAEKEKAMNSLESFIFETQDKLSQSEYEKASTEEERTELSGKLSEASDWLYEDGYDADAKVFKEKYKELKKLFKELFFRVKEHQERPQLIKRLKESLNASTHFIKVAKNLTSSGLDDTFTEVEMETLEKLINETEEWKTTKVAEQKNTPKSEKPTLLTEDIKEKISALDREVMYLLNKAKREKPKKDKERAKKEKERLKAENETKTEEEIKIETGAEKSEDEDAQVVDEGEEGVWPIDAPDPRDEQNVDGDKETIETQEELPETNETVENEKEEEEILQIDSPNETG